MSSAASGRGGPGRVRRVAVIGASFAALGTAARLCELGIPVTLMSRVPPRHGPSVSAQDGLNAALDLAGEGDTPAQHLEDCLRAADGLCQRPPLAALVTAAPEIFERAHRWGVSFEPAPGGGAMQRRASGSRHRRTAYAGGATGRCLVDALDDQLDRWAECMVAGEPLLLRLEYWDLLDLIQDDQGAVIGVVAEDQTSGRIRAWPTEAVCLGTGGYAGLFSGGNPHTGGDGAALAIASRHGAVLANLELVQFEPTVVLGGARPWLAGELLRAAGARLWTPQRPGDQRRPLDLPSEERDYLLERVEPELGDLPTADRAARALFAALRHEGRGAFDPVRGRTEETVYLDAHGLDRAWFQASFGRLSELGVHHFGHDPIHAPWRVGPAPHRSLGGLWVDFEATSQGDPVPRSPRQHATSLPGLYAVGEAACQYRGACRLGGQLLLEELFGARLAAEAMAASRQGARGTGAEAQPARFGRAEDQCEAERRELIGRRRGSEDPWAIQDELGRLLTEAAGIERTETALREGLVRLSELEARFTRAEVSDQALVHNHALGQVRRLEHGLVLGRLVLESALMRQECRGVHFEPLRAEKRERRGSPRSVLVRFVGAGRVERVTEFAYDCVGDPISVTDAVGA